MEQLFFEIRSIMSSKPVDFLAIDPGLRKCGIARAFTSYDGITICYSLEEPILSTYDPSAAKAIHATRMTDLEATAVGGNFVSQLFRDYEGSEPGEVLIETQPPSGVTKSSGRSTRAYTNALVTGFMAKKWHVIMKTVKAYKEPFGIRVMPHRIDNKDNSVRFVRAISLQYPYVMKFAENAGLLKNPDICDALILLFSRFVELVPRENACLLLGLDIREPSWLQLLQVGLLTLEQELNEALRPQLKLMLRHIKDNELITRHPELFNVPCVAPITYPSRNTRQKKIAGMHIVPVAIGSLASPSIMNPPPMNHSSHPPQKS